MALSTDTKIFLVDDDIFCLNLYQQFLAKLGFTNVVCFGNGDDCLKSLSKKPDIIFLDYYMEGLNGLEVLREIKRSNPDIVVVFISGQEDVEVAVDALTHGAFDYIVKSKINPEQLQQTLDKIAKTVKIAPKAEKRGFLQRMFK